MRPTVPALACGTLLLALALALPFLEGARPVFTALAGALCVAMLADAIALWRRPLPHLERKLPPTMALGARYDIELRISARDAARLLVHDRPPDAGEASGMPLHLDLPAGRSAALTYRFRPLARGELRFGRPVVRFLGPLRLLERECQVGETATTRVFPNFRHLASYVSPGETLHFQGVRLQRRRGEGMEFHQLRLYQEGDPQGHIDWKSVSRRQRLVTREYRAEENQNVIFLLDCGRRMRAHDGELTLLDQALNALLLLSHVALHQGDAVGLFTFGGKERWLSPVRGARGLEQVLDVAYDLESTTEPGDLESAAARLLARQRRRALVVVLTNLGDEDAESLRETFHLLRGKHLVLLASLRDPEWIKPLSESVDDSREALLALSTLAYLRERRVARKRIAASGIATLESEPNALPVKLVEHYMRIKRAGTL